MKFALIAVTSLLLSGNPATAFAPPTQATFRTASSSSALGMAVDMPPPEPETAVVKTQELPTVAPNVYGQPSDIRYSDFLKLVNGDKVEKVTFSADGTQLLGVDVDGTRLKIETLPNDPDLLTQLTTHKVTTHAHTHPSVYTHAPTHIYLYSVSVTTNRLMLRFFLPKKQVGWVSWLSPSFSPPFSLPVSFS